MEEQIKQEEVKVSENTMTEINQEINKVEQTVVNAAKEEGKQEVVTEVAKGVNELKVELETLRTENAKVAEAVEARQLQADIEAEKKKIMEAQQVTQRQAIVPESTNPNQLSSKEAPTAPLPREAQWDQLEQAVSKGGFRATVDLE